MSTVDIATCSLDPEGTVRRAMELKTQRLALVDNNETLKPEYDEVWCVFDSENPRNNQNIKSAIQLAINNNVQVALSTPAFEFWFLLHFIYTDQQFVDANDVIRELKGHFPKYKKNLDLYHEISDQTDAAISRAKRVLANCLDGEYLSNPSTRVHLLVEKLISQSRW